MDSTASSLTSRPRVQDIKREKALSSNLRQSDGSEPLSLPLHKAPLWMQHHVYDILSVKVIWL
jgi:hypothetical protein